MSICRLPRSAALGLAVPGNDGFFRHREPREWCGDPVRNAPFLPLLLYNEKLSRTH
jgi:hypothetical protein